ncbi:HAD hydrolase family protein [Leuconostoc gasicomitatum]|uniref:HAD hydrolase family protein n=1 Tax=Leuconostoc gasicomitatum TaxID=115778 RepID=UPI000B7FFCF8|nr:HAD hydrolase family protein [Leuconostoc gasicomitatum]
MNQKIEPNLLNKLLMALQSYGLPTIIHTVLDNWLFFDFENNDDVYSNARIQKIADEYATKILKTKHASKDIYDLYWTTFFEECKGKVGIKESVELENVTGVEVFFSDIHEQSRLKKTFPRKEGQCTESYYTSIEFNTNSSKGIAINDYIEKNNIKFSYSIGNGLNDESMFLVTDISYKMIHSNPTLSAKEIPFSPKDPFLKYLF